MNKWTWFSEEEIASWPADHKKCRRCQEVLPFSSFHKHRNTMYGYNTICKTCRIPTTKKNYHNQSTEVLLFNRAKSRATLLGREFSITVDDILVPEKCPVLGAKLVRGSRDHAPSLDRIDSSVGYVPGNVQVISSRANTLKNNASLEEIEKLYFWMKGMISSDMTIVEVDG